MSSKEGPVETPNPDELQSLIDRCLDGRMNDQQIERLESLLLGNPAAQESYLDACQLHQLINIENRASRVVQRMREQLESRASEQAFANHVSSEGGLPWKRGYRWLAAISVAVTAASILVAVSFWWLTSVGSNPNGIAHSPGQPPVSQEFQGIPDYSMLVDAEGRFQQVSFDFGAETEERKLGDFGIAIFEGPGRAEWISPMRMKLHRGRIKIRIDDPAGHGFTIETPSTSVTDLGTEFAIDVSEVQTSTVVVFNGEVDLVVLTSDPEEPQPTKKLFGGDGLIVSATGAVSRLMAIATGRNATFSHVGEHVGNHPFPLIRDVSDNVLGLDSKRFYEIVPGGFREDSKAYVDRPEHEWNGIDQQGLPEYLLGVDYIKTYNGDKQRRHLTIDVTLSAAADLFVFFDARLPAPQWLTTDFRDTGDKIGLDMGQWRGADGRLIIRETAGVGPGESIDAEFTVWVRRVEQAGVVRLGSAAGPTGLSAMYGIAAAGISAE